MNVPSGEDAGLVAVPEACRIRYDSVGLAAVLMVAAWPASCGGAWADADNAMSTLPTKPITFLFLFLTFTTSLSCMDPDHID
jgi:hypothetical protein